MKLLALLAIAAVIAGAAEKKVAMKDLPAAVQKTVQDQTNGAEIKGLSRETENGKTSYEVETMVNGKHRDLEIDAQGAVTEVEEETSLDSIPPAAKATIEKRAAGGKIGMVEAVSHAGAIVFYEAHFTARSGKKQEVQVKPDGAETKE